MARTTAVEWLVNKLLESGVNFLSDEKKFIVRAKEREREQMEDAYDKGKASDKFAPDDSFNAYFTKYYEKEGDYEDRLERYKYLKDL